MSEIVTQPLILKKKSRSSRFAKWMGGANSFRDRLLRGIYVFLLFGMDFVMFIYSINGRLFEDGYVNRAAFYILGLVLGSSIILMLILSFSKLFQNLLCAVATLLFTVLFFYQFGQGNVDTLFEQWLNKNASWLSFLGFIPTPWFFGLIFAISIFFLFSFSDVILFITLVLLFSCFVGVYNNERLPFTRSEYQEVKRLPSIAGGVRDDSIVYMMMPKFPSYQFLSGIRDINFRELRDLMIGFYAVNNFEIYPNAFVQKNDTMSNIIDILNQVDYTSSTSGDRGYVEFIDNWNFIHGGREILGLSNNKLYDHLRKGGFGISMYAMPEFNFCLKNGDFGTDRCVIKGYKTVSLYDPKASLEKNVNSLLGEWLLSFKISDLKSYARSFINDSPLRNMKIISENRRVSMEGSVDIFEKLKEDYLRDAGGQVYLVYVDFPSDVYIYDEFCNLKPRKDWIALKDNSLYSGGIDEKRKAYAEQAKCLIAKLQEYIDEIKDSSRFYRTDIYIQGVSPIRELAGMTSDQYSRFAADNLVNLAVRKGRKPRFLINANVCLASDFTKSMLKFQDYCYTLDNMTNYTTDEILNLKKNLINNAVIRGGKISNIMANYRDWYENFKLNSHEYQLKLQQKKAEEEARRQAAEEERLKRERERDEVKTDEQKVQRTQNNENIFIPTDDMVIDLNEEMLSEQETPTSDVAKSPEAKAVEENANKDTAKEVVPDISGNVVPEDSAVAPVLQETSASDKAEVPAVAPVVEKPVEIKQPDVKSEETTKQSSSEEPKDEADIELF